MHEEKIIRKHLSDIRITQLTSRAQKTDSVKPLGLWYDVNNEWSEWCASEMPHWIENKISYKIDIDKTDIITINDSKELHYFTQSFEVIPDKYNIPGRINWREVSNKFKGIEIPRYLYESRLDMSVFWYYGWDVASGCIWDVSAIKGISEII